MKLTVVSYNIHKCIGRDGKCDPRRTAATIAEFSPDVVMLQEVDEGAKRSFGERQVDVLGDLLGFAFRAFAVNVTLRSGGGYGNAILSRWPILSEHNLDVTTPLKKARSVLHAEVALPNDAPMRRLHVFNLHLGLAQYERKRQLQTFIESERLAQATSGDPVVAAGDFNDVYGNLRNKIAPHGFRSVEKPPRTFPAALPLRALDSLYVRGPAQVQALQRGETESAKIASDHRPLIGQIELTPFA